MKTIDTDRTFARSANELHSKMVAARDREQWEQPSLSSKEGRTLPLLPTILASVLIGVAAASLSLYAGYGLIVALISYVFFGAFSSFFLPLTFYELFARKKNRESDAEDYGGIFGRSAGNADFKLHTGSWAMFVAGETKDTRDVRGVIEEAGFVVRDSPSLHDAIQTILDAPKFWDLLCVDIDAFGEEEEAGIVTEKLASIRTAAPNVPILLLSRSFSLPPDAFHHRLGASYIADRCLRIPAAVSNIKQALEDAMISSWKMR